MKQEMARLFGLLGCVIVLAALFDGSAAQTTHTVLENTGWVIPFQGGAALYTAWAATQTFVVGDTLFFNFTSGQHDVAQVTRTSFDNCAGNSTISPIILEGPASVTLSSTGAHYFICTVGPHCVMGQKLAITVTGSSPGPTAGGPTSTPSPTAGGPTSTPSGPPSTPTNGPTTSPAPPQSTGPSTAPPPPSSSSVVISTSSFVAVGTFVLVILGIIM